MSLLFSCSGESVAFDAQPINLAVGKDGLAVIICIDQTVNECVFAHHVTVCSVSDIFCYFGLSILPNITFTQSQQCCFHQGDIGPTC
jgi:hypothetical protein